MSSLTTLLFDNNGRAQEPLLQILSSTKTPHDGTARSIREVTQNLWYQAGRIRAEIEERHGPLREELMPYFRQLRMVDAILPPAGQYEYCLLLGGTIVAVRKRLKFLDQLTACRAWCQKVVFLGSTRKLMDREYTNLHDPKNPDCPFDARNTVSKDPPPQTEGDMMRIVAKQVFGTDDDHTVSVCVAPDVSGRNANTFDTVFYWHRNVAKKPGPVIALSSQPFIGFQDEVCQSVLGSEYPVTTIGYAANADTKVSVYLDNLAKWIYQIMMTRNW